MEERGWWKRPRTVTTFDKRVQEHVEIKRLIAKRACQFVKNGDTVYIDAGSTCLLLAAEIKDMNIHVVTNSIDCMALLCTQRNIELFSLGGQFLYDSRAFCGTLAVNTLASLHINTCFIGAAGFTAEGVFSSQNTHEARLKQEVLASSSRRIALVDSSKFQKSSFAIFARSRDIDIVVSDTVFATPVFPGESGITTLLVDPFDKPVEITVSNINN